jgi:hypothetical protein
VGLAAAPLVGIVKPQVDRPAVIRLFEEIRAAFPSLTMELQLEPPNVDLNMDVREQPGLTFAVNLNLQGDELHLSAGSFWLEWFPCTDPAIVAYYRGAVTGLLSGEYRILEHYVGTRVVKAQLQLPDGEAWRTIGTSSSLWTLLPWPRTQRVLQNRHMQ